MLVSASVSNWGAYAIAAQLAYELKEPDLFQTEEMEDFMLRRCVATGGTDGAYAAQLLSVDGTSARTQRALVAMLREIVTNGLKKVYRGFSLRKPLSTTDGEARANVLPQHLSYRLSLHNSKGQTRHHTAAQSRQQARMVAEYGRHEAGRFSVGTQRHNHQLGGRDRVTYQGPSGSADGRAHRDASQRRTHCRHGGR